MLPISARSPAALRSLAETYQNLLAGKDAGSTLSLQDLCYTASVRRTHHDWRLFLVGHSYQEFAEHLRDLLHGEGAPALSSGDGLVTVNQGWLWYFPDKDLSGSPWGGSCLSKSLSFALL